MKKDKKIMIYYRGRTEEGFIINFINKYSIFNFTDVCKHRGRIEEGLRKD